MNDLIVKMKTYLFKMTKEKLIYMSQITKNRWKIY